MVAHQTLDEETSPENFDEPHFTPCKSLGISRAADYPAHCARNETEIDAVVAVDHAPFGSWMAARE